MRIVTDYKHAQQIIIELDAEIERLTARLIAESGEVEDLVNRLQESEDDNGRLMKRIAKLEGVRESVVKMGNDLRYEADDWAVDPELARQYIEPVYQTALAATEQGESDG